MKVSILGGGGFLGRRLAGEIARSGAIGGQRVSALTLFDIAAPALPPASFSVRSVSGDLAELPDAAIPADTGIVFHLASVVSAAAEADFELGRRVNLRGTDAVIDACRRLERPPRVVFTSSVATFSGGQDAVLGDDARQLPAGSYGAQKAAAELALQDASRRGFLDAVNIRLPTVIVRPGRPNRAASSFVSAIIREPLLGLETELPVSEAFAVWVCSPRRAVDWLLHAAAMETAPLGLDRGINPPGMSITVARLLRTLEEVKPGASALVRRVENEVIGAIVKDWPAAFDPVRAPLFGFSRHEALIDVVRAFVAEDLEPTRRERGLG